MGPLPFPAGAGAPSFLTPWEKQGHAARVFLSPWVGRVHCTLLSAGDVASTLH